MQKAQFTKEQFNFYEYVRKKAKKNPKLLKRITNQYEMCEHLYRLALKDNLNIDILEKFPYKSEEQKTQFKRRILSNMDKQSSEVKVTYFSTPKK